MALKKVTLFLAINFFVLANINAQVGINTKKPLGWFHIDTNGNTEGTTLAPTNDSDDVIITFDGNMGIGTALPTNKLTIVSTGTNTGLHLPNGAGTGKVLTSDAYGNGVWNQPGFSEFTNIPQTASQVTLAAGTHFINSGLSFNFPIEGTYSVTLQCRMTANITGRSVITDRPVLQILPNIEAATDISTAWSSGSINARFTGSYEIMSIARTLEPATTSNEYRFIFSQNMQVTTLTGLKATLVVYIRCSETVTLTFNYGTPTPTTVSPQTIGGSFIRIN
ncbi:hypothetical protein [Dysgonomonas macrotermitis]|nr:hypothetical protein [Dysgonomonas macrotermitis]